MKVILLNDVKNVGKKGQVVEVSDGYARNFLIRNKQAVEATKKSLEVLDTQKVEAKLKEKELEAQAHEISKQLEGIMLKFTVKTGAGGKVFGAVSTKQIVDELNKKHGISIDKRKFIDHDSVGSLGVSKLRVELFKDVIGTVTVQLLEKQ